MTNVLPPYTIRGWQSLGRTARQLISARLFRAVAQGALAVDFTLYLKARGWSAPEIGLLLMASGLVGAGLSLFVGIVSDRVGRRLFLLIYECGLIIGTALILATPSAWVVAVPAILFGFGRGANGSSGPFAPAEQAWLAQAVPLQRRASVFSFNAGLQFVGMGVGSLLAALLPQMSAASGGPAGYLPIFVLNLIAAVVNLWQIWSIREAATKEEPRFKGNADTITKKENRALTLLVTVNMVNALGVGIIAPLLPYWFNLKFGVGPAAIGPVYAITFFLTAAFTLVIARLSDQVGLVRAIILPRILGVALLVAIPFMPTFAWAAVLYVARSIVNRSSLGARQAFSVSLVRDRRRGLATSLNAVSWSLAGALGPAFGGWLIGIGALVWPFLAAAALQTGYVILFPVILGRYDVNSRKQIPDIPVEHDASQPKRHSRR